MLLEEYLASVCRQTCSMQSTGEHNNLIATKAIGESNIFAWRPVITSGSQTSLKGLCDGGLIHLTLHYCHDCHMWKMLDYLILCI